MKQDIKTYLQSTLQRIKDEELLGKAVLGQWEIMIDQAIQTDSLSLDKSTLKNSIQKNGKVTDANFRKRISLLNGEFKDNDLGIRINNNDCVVITVDDKAIENNSYQNTKTGVLESNNMSVTADEKLIQPMASQSPMPKRQVLFSYAWASDKRELVIQRRFSEMLQKELLSPPAEFLSDAKVNLFIDVNGFELGENTKNQQDAMCIQTPCSVICYTNKYLHSTACQEELNYYLNEDGNNIEGRHSVIVPFDSGFAKMGKRYQQNLAHVPSADFQNALDLFERGSITEQKDYVAKLVFNIYNWFRKNPHPPEYDEFRKEKQAVVASTCNIDLDPDKIETSKASQKQTSNDDEVEIVNYLVDWANGDESNTRLFYLLGDFGSGKSTTCQMLTYQLMENFRKSNNDTHVLPIYLDLKKLLNAFGNDPITGKSVESLIEVMLSSTGAKHKVSGAQIIQLIKQYPCLLIFDGFDEVGHKLDKSKQEGLLNQLLSIFPNRLYKEDLERLRGNPINTHTDIPLKSRILLSCRTHFFKSYSEQQAFTALFYRHPAGKGGRETKNFQTFYMLPLSKEQIENYLKNWLGEEEGQKAITFINSVHDLTGLSESPLMLDLIRDLLPDLQEEAKHNSHINASTLYKLLFDKVGGRDNEKHIIPLDEKRKLLGRFALHLWQAGETTIDVEELKAWFIENRSDYPTLEDEWERGKISHEVLLQDLHNASLLIRDAEDEYRFAHTSFYEFFTAVGIFDAVINCPNLAQGLEQVLSSHEINTETIQFLIDWRLANKTKLQKKFDAHWQVLQNADSPLFARKMGFEITQFALTEQQQFTKVVKPSWQGLSFERLSFRASFDIDLNGANLSETVIEECSFHGVDLSDVNFSNSYLRQNNFNACIFSNVDITESQLKGNRFYACQALNEMGNSLDHDGNIITSNHSIPIKDGKLGTNNLTRKASGEVQADISLNSECIIHTYNDELFLFRKINGFFYKIASLDYYFTQQIAISHDGNSVAIASQQKLLIFDVSLNRFEMVATFEGYSNVSEIVFSADNHLFLIDSGKIIRLNLFDNCIAPQEIMPSNATCLDLNNDNLLLIGTSHGACFYQQNEEEWQYLEAVPGLENKKVSNVSLSNDGEKATLVCDSELYYYERSNSIIESLFSENKIQKAQISQDNESILVSSDSGVSVFNLSERRKQKSLGIFNRFSELFLVLADSEHYYLAISLSQLSIVTKCEDNLTILQTLTDQCTSLANIYYCNAGINFWAGKNKVTIQKEKFTFNRTIEYSTSGQYKCEYDKYFIRIYENENARYKLIAKINERYCSSFYFSSNENFLVITLMGTFYRLFTLDKKIPLGLGYTDLFNGLEFSNNQNYIAMVSRHKIDIGKITDKRVREIDKISIKNSTCVCFHPLEQTLLTGEDEKIRIWHVSDSGVKLKREVLVNEIIFDMHFSADGKNMLFTSDKGAQFWGFNDSDIHPTSDFYPLFNVESFAFDEESANIAISINAQARCFKLEKDEYGNIINMTLDKIIEVFDGAGIVYDADYQVTSMTGEAWKYLNNKVINEDGSVEILPPDTHPDWANLVKDN